MSNAEGREFWNGTAGSRWVALQERIQAAFAPITTAVLRKADVQPGETVFDIGCGCGDTVLALSHAVGSHGSVTGLDVSEPMLALAAQRVDALRLTNVRLVLADAATHDASAAAADVAFSRFGVMFFDDPVAAFQNIRRAMRPDGRLTFVCWRTLADNPWFHVPVEAAKPYVAAQPSVSESPAGPLAFADPDRVRAILRAAGFVHIALEAFDTPLILGDREAAVDLVMRLGPTERVLTGADDATRARAAAAIDAAFRVHEVPAGVSLGAGVWLVSARVA